MYARLRRGAEQTHVCSRSEGFRVFARFISKRFDKLVGDDRLAIKDNLHPCTCRDCYGFLFLVTNPGITRNLAKLDGGRDARRFTEDLPAQRSQLWLLRRAPPEEAT
jgi:hypothetical protein